MKEIVIRYKTCKEYKIPHSPRSHIEVLIDGEPLKNLKSFSIKVEAGDSDPIYTIEKYMDYPSEKEYNEIVD